MKSFRVIETADRGSRPTETVRLERSRGGMRSRKIDFPGANPYKSRLNSLESSVVGICSAKAQKGSIVKYTDEQIFDTLASFFVQEGTSRNAAPAVAPDTDIIGQGLVDSLGIFRLIAFVEEKFKVTIEPDEVLLENFQTLQALRNLIVTKLDSAGQKQVAV